MEREEEENPSPRTAHLGEEADCCAVITTLIRNIALLLEGSSCSLEREEGKGSLTGDQNFLAGAYT